MLIGSICVSLRQTVFGFPDHADGARFRRFRRSVFLRPPPPGTRSSQQTKTFGESSHWNIPRIGWDIPIIWLGYPNNSMGYRSRLFTKHQNRPSGVRKGWRLTRTGRSPAFACFNRIAVGERLHTSTLPKPYGKSSAWPACQPIFLSTGGEIVCFSQYWRGFAREGDLEWELDGCRYP